LVVLATIATVIASQAVISGAFSLAHQASQLGYLPRLRVIHTSERQYGQVYVPVINWLLLAAVLALVLAFQTSVKLAFAYGMAVTGTIIITTFLFFFVVRHRWHRPLWLVILGAAGFGSVELTFLASNLTKFTHGGWLPLTIGLFLFTVMVTWYRGRELVTAERLRAEGPLSSFVDELHAKDPPVARVPGTAVFLNRGKETAPLAMRTCVDHLHSLHEHVVILSLERFRCRTFPTRSISTSTSSVIGTTASLSSGRSTATSRRSTSRPRSGRSRTRGSSVRWRSTRRRTSSPGSSSRRPTSQG